MHLPRTTRTVVRITKPHNNEMQRTKHGSDEASPLISVFYRRGVLPTKRARVIEPETTVGIVLDRGFGDRLLELPPRMPVWIIDTPRNRGPVQSIRASEPARSITTFVDVPSEGAEDLLIGILSTIELHHGESSQDPPYSALQVFGAAPTLQVREALEEYNLVVVTEAAHHFDAARSIGTR